MGDGPFDLRINGLPADMKLAVGGLNEEDTVAITTKGGPINSTRVIQYYIFDQAFRYSNIGYASAMAWVPLLSSALLPVRPNVNMHFSEPAPRKPRYFSSRPASSKSE